MERGYKELDLTSYLPVDSGGCLAAQTTRYFCDAFESGLGNWTLSSKDWNTTNASSAVSGSLSFTESPDGRYLCDEIASATLAGMVDLTKASAPALMFWHRLALATGETYASVTDTAYVEVSTDGGLDWSQLTSYTPSSNTSTWSQQVVSLASYIGKSVIVRFRLQDNGYRGYGSVASTPCASSYLGDGWSIDYVEIAEL